MENQLNGDLDQFGTRSRPWVLEGDAYETAKEWVMKVDLPARACILVIAIIHTFESIYLSSGRLGTTTL